MVKTKPRRPKLPPLIGTTRDGWGRCGRDPNVSHFFLDGRSLCLDYDDYGVRRKHPVDSDGYYTPTRADCRRCAKALEARGGVAKS